MKKSDKVLAIIYKQLNYGKCKNCDERHSLNAKGFCKHCIANYGSLLDW